MPLSSIPSCLLAMKGRIDNAILEGQIKELQALKAQKEAEKPTDVAKILGKVRYFLEHLDELLIKQIDPVKKAQLFGALFDRLPTYEEIKPGTPKTPLFTGVSQVFQLLKDEKISYGDPTGNRTRVFAVRGRCPNR